MGKGSAGREAADAGVSRWGRGIGGWSREWEGVVVPDGWTESVGERGRAGSRCARLGGRGRDGEVEEESGCYDCDEACMLARSQELLAGC